MVPVHPVHGCPFVVQQACVNKHVATHLPYLMLILLWRRPKVHCVLAHLQGLQEKLLPSIVTTHDCISTAFAKILMQCKTLRNRLRIETQG